jgi:hypothetical protein
MVRMRLEGPATASVAALMLAGCMTLGDAQTTTAPYTWEGRMVPGSTLEIRGVNGSVRAVPATGSEARVEAVRTGRRSDPSEVRIEVVEHAGGVTICAVYPGQRNACRPGSDARLGANRNDVQVNFDVEVPAGVHLTARTANGRVTAERMSGRVEAYSSNGNVRIDGGSYVEARTTNGSISIRTSGEATARTTNGSLTVELGQVSGSSPLRFSSTNGSITLTIPSALNAAIDARTSNGSIDSELPITIRGSVSRRQLAGTIGSGGTPLELRTTNGNIRIRGS